MNRTFKLFCAVICLLSTPLAAQEREERWHDLGGSGWMDIHRVFPASILPLQATIHLDDETFDGQDLGEWDRESGSSVEGMLAALGLALGPARRDRVESSFADGWQLRVVASAADQDAVAEALSALRTEGLRQARVDVFELDARALAEAPPGRLAASTIAKLLEKFEARRSSRRQLQLGNGTRFNSGRRIGLVPLAEVEVAQVATVDSPSSRSLLLGQDLAIAVHRATEGRVLVQCGLRFADLISGPVSSPIGLGNVHGDDATRTRVRMGDLQMATLDSTLLRSSARLKSGEGLLFGSGDDNQGHAWLVRVSFAAAEPGAASPHAATLAAGDLITREFSPQWFGPAIQDARGRDWKQDWSEGSDEQAACPASEDDIIDAITAWADRADIEGIEMISLGDRLVMQGPKAARDQARSLIKRLSMQSANNLHFELRMGSLPRTALAEFSQEQLAELPQRARASAREGDFFGIASGAERSRIVDYDSEIAQAASVLAPLTRALFSGFEFAGRAQETPEGTISLHGRFFRQREMSHRSFGGGEKDRGPVDQADTNHCEQFGSWTLAPGEWHPILISPERGSSNHFIVALRVTSDL